MKKRVCILTWHQYHNFGSQLQAFALRKVLEKNNYDARIINYRRSLRKESLSLLFKSVLGFFVEKTGYQKLQRYRYSWLRFQRKYLNLTRPLIKEQLKNEVKKYEVLICGSDQIWAPNVLDTTYMADFIGSSDIRKVSYAASIGLTHIPDNMVDVYKSLLNDFEYISVRESKGAELIKSITGLNASVVLDPTLLLKMEDYNAIEVIPSECPSRFCFCYFLNTNHWYKSLVEDYARKHDLAIIGVSSNLNDISWMKQDLQCGPREFLWYIHHANIVFTDSYHGTIFSLIYHTPYYVFQRFRSDDPINQNSRIIQLIDYFSISDRYVTCGIRTLPRTNCSFNTFDETIEDLRKSSTCYLMEALK